jgi:O-antigen ligase
LVMLVAIGFYLLQKKIKITELSWVTILGSALVVPAIFVLISKLPAAYLTTFKWRVGLWEIGLKILQHMNILLFGNGMDEFGKIAYYGQPHNLYIYLLLQYGVFGILLLLIMIGIILKMGINIYNIPIQLRDPLLTSSLFGLVGFLIIGLVESNLMGIEMRQIFVIYLSIFIGVYRQNYHQKLFGALNANTNRFAEHSSSI